MYMIFLLCYKMWAIPTGASWLLKKKKKKSPSPESRVPETGSDPPIGSDRGSGRDTYCASTLRFSTVSYHQVPIVLCPSLSIFSVHTSKHLYDKYMNNEAQENKSNQL